MIGNRENVATIVPGSLHSLVVWKFPGEKLDLADPKTTRAREQASPAPCRARRGSPPVF